MPLFNTVRNQILFTFFFYTYINIKLYEMRKRTISTLPYSKQITFFYYYFIPDGAKFCQFFDSQPRSPSQGRQQRFYMYISPLMLTLVRRAGWSRPF